MALPLQWQCCDSGAGASCSRQNGGLASAASRRAFPCRDCITPGNGKPHPETFLRAAELIGVPPEHCVG